MPNLIRLLDNTFQEIPKETIVDGSQVNLIEIRSVDKSAKTITVELGTDTTGFQPTDLLVNNDSLEPFYSAFTVCLQKLEVDCDTYNDISSVLTVDSTQQYQVLIDGTTTVLYGDALVDFLNEQPNIKILKEM